MGESVGGLDSVRSMGGLADALGSVGLWADQPTTWARWVFVRVEAAAGRSRHKPSLGFSLGLDTNKFCAP